VPLNAADWSLVAGPAADDWVSALAVDGYGSIWFATDKGIWRYAGGGWRVYTTDDGLPTNDTWGLALTPGGAPLAGVCGGLFRLAGERWESVDPQAPESTAKSCFQALAAGPDGSVWMGLVNPKFGAGSGPGVLRFDGQAWLSYNDRDESPLAGFETRPVVLPGSDVALTLVDAGGALWALMDQGLARFDGTAWTVYDASNSPLSTRLWGLLQDQDGGLWVGTEAGAARFDGQSWAVYAPADGLESLMVPLAAGPDGALWFHTSGGLLRLAGEAWQRFELPPALAGQRAWAGAVGPDGALWLGTWGGGAFRYLPGEPALTGVVPVPTSMPTATPDLRRRMSAPCQRRCRAAAPLPTPCSAA
jgi:ligand-binding sensor domain-containing protein